MCIHVRLHHDHSNRSRFIIETNTRIKMLSSFGIHQCKEACLQSSGTCQTCVSDVLLLGTIVVFLGSHIVFSSSHYTSSIAHSADQHYRNDSSRAHAAYKTR